MWARTAKRHLATRNAETCDQLLSVERIVGYIRWNLPLAIRHIAEHRSGRLIRLRMAQDYQKRTYQGSHQELRFMPKLRKSQMTGTEVKLITSPMRAFSEVKTSATTILKTRRSVTARMNLSRNQIRLVKMTMKRKAMTACSLRRPGSGSRRKRCSY